MSKIQFSMRENENREKINRLDCRECFSDFLDVKNTKIDAGGVKICFRSGRKVY